MKVERIAEQDNAPVATLSVTRQELKLLRRLVSESWFCDEIAHLERLEGTDPSEETRGHVEQRKFSTRLLDSLDGVIAELRS